MRKRLKDSEAKLLGIEPKPKEGSRNPRYTITDDQLKRLENSKLTITGKSTLKDSDGKIVMEWTKTNLTKERQLESARLAIEAMQEDIKPVSHIKFNGETSGNLCNQYTITDFHLGMMAWSEESGADWDMKIAEELLIKWFERAIQISPNSSQAIFAQIGDFLHWDGLDAVTPMNKHLLDADTRFSKLVRTSIRVIRQVVSMLLDKHEKVHIIMAEGNHDPASSVWLREMFDFYYSQEDRVTVDTSPDIYYHYNWGKVSLYYHHGHKRRGLVLQNAFISKFKEFYGNSKFNYGHSGHFHAEKTDSGLMVIEQHPTLAAKDAYASRGGYHSNRNAKVITYHKEFGEVGRLTISPEMIK
jgi:hypothetical protein